MSKQQRNTLIRLAVSVIGVVLVVLTVDVGQATNDLVGIRGGGFAAAVALFQVGLVVRAARWWVLLRSHDVRLPLWKLVRLYYFGMFFNLFLPTGFGGDVVRAAELGSELDVATSAATVLLDRMMGLMSLFMIALIMTPFAWGVVPSDMLTLTAAVSLVGLVGGVLVIQGGLFGAILRTIDRVLGRVGLIRKLVGAFIRFNDAIAVVGQHRRAVLEAFAISTAFNALLILMHIVLSRALALDVPALGYVLIVPLTSILLLVPSIQGIGVRETAFVVLMGSFGAPEPTALALSLAVLLQNVISGVIGLVLYVPYTLRQPAPNDAPPQTPPAR